MPKGTLEGCVLEIIGTEETYGYAITPRLNELGFRGDRLVRRLIGAEPENPAASSGLSRAAANACATTASAGSTSTSRPRGGDSGSACRPATV
jgi:hypothetical protein